MKTQRRSMTLIVGIFVLIVGCQTLPRESVLMKEVDAVNLSAYQLRLMLNDFAARFSGAVEGAADEIMARASDPEIKKNALLWKMNAIPASQKALFLGDPLAALADIATFCVQMRQYLTEGAGKNLFGRWQKIAGDASNQLEMEIFEIAKRVQASGHIERGEKFIYSWANDNPIVSLLLTRKSTIDSLAALAGEQNTDLVSTLGSLSENMNDITERLTIYTGQLPKQVRWQAEYLIDEYIESEKVETGLENFSSITESVERITEVIEQSPAFIDGQLDKQRLLLMEDLRNERVAIIDAIRKERIAVLDELSNQRIATLKEFEVMTIAAIDKSSHRMNDLVDHIFWRTAQLLGATLVLSFLVIYIVRKKQ